MDFKIVTVLSTCQKQTNNHTYIYIIYYIIPYTLYIIYYLHCDNIFILKASSGYPGKPYILRGKRFCALERIKKDTNRVKTCNSCNLTRTRNHKRIEVSSYPR